MREDRMHEVFFSRLQPHCHHKALDKLCNLGPHHVRAEQLTGLGIKYGFYQPIGLTERNGFAGYSDDNGEMIFWVQIGTFDAFLDNVYLGEGTVATQNSSWNEIKRMYR